MSLLGEWLSLEQKKELLVFLVSEVSIFVPLMLHPPPQAGQYLTTVYESGHNMLLPQEYFTIISWSTAERKMLEDGRHPTVEIYGGSMGYEAITLTHLSKILELWLCCRQL